MTAIKADRKLSPRRSLNVGLATAPIVGRTATIGAPSGNLIFHVQPPKLRLDFPACSQLGLRMNKADHKRSNEIAATMVLAARLIMEDASARIAVPSVPPRSLLTELARLIDDTAKQLEALSIAAHAAL